MKKIIGIVLGASILFGVLVIPVLGQTTGSSEPEQTFNLLGVFLSLQNFKIDI